MGFSPVSPNICGLKRLQLPVDTHGSLWSFTDLSRLLWPQEGGLQGVQAHFGPESLRLMLARHGKPGLCDAGSALSCAQVLWVHTHRGLALTKHGLV